MRKQTILILMGVGSVLASPAQISPIKSALFSEGDDMKKAAPAYNESGMRIIDITRPWSDQNVNGVDYGWYRIHLNIPKSLVKDKDFADFIQFNLGPIDDADEVYLNGKLIGKTGGMPGDAGGYQSKWSVNRQYAVKSNDKAINWDGDNVLAVRCYNGNDPGGMFNAQGVTITVPELIEGVSITSGKGKNGKETVTVNNRYDKAVKGTLSIEEVDNETGKVLSQTTHKVSASASKPGVVSNLTTSPGSFLRLKFTDDRTGKDVVARSHPKFILTPAAPAAPRFNTAAIYGVRPGSPVHYRFGVSGERPMTFSSTNLPEGLTINPENGALSGSLAKRGDYTFTVKATNAKGTAEQKFTIKVGDKIALTPPMGWNSWNCWGLSVTQDRVVSSAQALIDKGLADYGYSYVNIDDAWEAPERNPDGTIAVNEKFPSMKELGDWLHGEGLKFGIYSSPGDLTCGCYLVSLYHELQDAETYNSWGID
ncbi:MAG: putative Ig domain-containing protein, partial [Muribaculaceae bacterium]|nr:putative Ig domain-containing protein [Muribaculaceae bacterium]